jgi:hypothetical protein
MAMRTQLYRITVEEVIPELTDTGVQSTAIRVRSYAGEAPTPEDAIMRVADQLEVEEAS